jgi:hypothetical protein
MKKLTIPFFAIIAVVLTFSSCKKDSDSILDELQGNEYLIKVNGEVYEEGQNLFAGIAPDLTDENAMQAGLGVTMSLYFSRDKYMAGEVLEVGLEENTNTSAVASGTLVFNKDTDNEEIVWYVALSGTATIVSKERIEFNLNCYSLDDIADNGGPAQGATPIIITGYVTENSPI